MGEIESGQTQPIGVPLRINWHFPEGTQSRYTDNVLVQTGQFGITISFFETQVPIILGSPEENKKQLEELGTIRADCVGKIVVSPDFIPVLVKALETGLENYRQARNILAEES
jgi:hypothetical protein